jgi:hypothetical protein
LGSTLLFRSTLFVAIDGERWQKLNLLWCLMPQISSIWTAPRDLLLLSSWSNELWLNGWNACQFSDEMDGLYVFYSLHPFCRWSRVLDSCTHLFIVWVIEFIRCVDIWSKALYGYPTHACMHTYVHV